MMMDLNGMELLNKKNYSKPVIEIFEIKLENMLDNSNLIVDKDDDNVDWDGPIIWS